MQRRSFFKWLFASVAGMWGLGAAGLITKYLKPPETSLTGESALIHVGPVSSLPNGSPQFFPHARQPVFVTRLATNEVVAVSAICTHYHCILKWDGPAKLYRCPCHQGSFDSFGNVMAGPPPSALRKLPVELRRGEVYVKIG
jgi:Rieske Fe-S protein